jgi:hypothetical protein
MRGENNKEAGAEGDGEREREREGSRRSRRRRAGSAARTYKVVSFLSICGIL